MRESAQPEAEVLEKREATKAFLQEIGLELVKSGLKVNWNTSQRAEKNPSIVVNSVLILKKSPTQENTASGEFWKMENEEIKEKVQAVLADRVVFVSSISTGQPPLGELIKL